jgi:hypothetical protein
MPLYTFVIKHRGKAVETEEPLDLPDVHAAWEEATSHAGEMLKDIDGSLEGNTEWSVEVREQGNKVRTIRITTECTK